MCPCYINVSKYISVTNTYLGQYNTCLQCIPSSMITVVSSIIEKDCYFLKAKFEALFVLDLSCFIYLPCTYDNDPGHRKYGFLHLFQG